MRFFRKKIKLENINPALINYTNLKEKLKIKEWELAIQFYSKKDLENSLKYINLTINKSYPNWFHFAFLANVQEELKNYSLAIESYKSAIEFSKDEDFQRYSMFNQIGYCYLESMDSTNALKYYSIALKFKEDLVKSEMADIELFHEGILFGVLKKRIYNNLANANYRLGNIAESINNCNSAIDEDENYSFPYFLLGQIYASKKDLNNSKKYFKKSAQLGHSLGLQYYKQLESLR